MSFDLDAGLARLSSRSRVEPLRRRPDAELTYIGSAMPGGGLLFDTTVYIDGLQDRQPDALIAAIATPVGHHSAICLAELTHALGRLDPRHPLTRRNSEAIVLALALIADEPQFAPSVQVIGEAGILAGIVARRSQVGTERRQALLNDAIIYLQAVEEQLTVVTRNIADFDLLNQVAPGGNILFYRQREKQ